MLKFISFVFIFLFLNAIANGQPIKERMLSDLDVIRSVFEVGYAPREWKEKNKKWNLVTEIDKTKEKIQKMNQPTVKKYQHLLRDFFHSMQDYHARIYFYSTEASMLPFQIKGANGHYFVTSIAKFLLSGNVFPVNVGDEIVTFDHKPVNSAIQELMESYFPYASKETNLAMAEYFLTLRLARVGHDVPQGLVAIGVRHKGFANVSNYNLKWAHIPEKVSNRFIGALQEQKDSTPKFVKNEFLNIKMIDPLYEQLYNCEANDSDQILPPLFGYRNSRLPPLGRIRWQSDKHSAFHAYTFVTQDRKLIGYIRIPHYLGGNIEATQFCDLIRYFEDQTDALVIDQLDNPGGLVLYCYALASMLTSTPLTTPYHRFAISQEDVFNAINDIPYFEQIRSDEDAQIVFGANHFLGLPVTHQITSDFLKFYKFLVSEWDAGRKLTHLHFMNLNHIP
ncbi:MAG: protease-like activity factor CPAF, partial [Parachlamydia sp.]|nr:protease-like activity factor CPAF [Parachlamydia sp.]